MTMQIVGTCLIVLAIMLMWASKVKTGTRMRYLVASVLVLIVVGIIDLVLLGRQEPTISAFIRSRFPIRLP